MPSYAGTAAFTDAESFLRSLEGRDFERGVLTYLHAIWPGLQQSPSMRGWDRRGVDLSLASEDGSSLHVGVQCKSFLPVTDERSMLAQIEGSIRTFKASGTHADLYVLVINRSQLAASFTAAVDAMLEPLVASGRLGAFRVTGVREVLEWASSELVSRINDQLIERHRRRTAAAEEYFELPFPIVANVPVATSTWTLQREGPADVKLDGDSDLNLGETLARADVRWTLISGLAGAGKTTAALHSLRAGGPTPIYVACRDLDDQAFSYGTTLVIDAVLQQAAVFDDFAPEDQAKLKRLASSGFTKQLRTVDAKEWLLILDGLDEHRRLTEPGGLARLSNQFAELRCPVVLATRAEHVRLLTGDLQAGLAAIAGADWRRPARHLELRPWSVETIVAFVNGVSSLQPLDSPSGGRLRDFARLIEEGRADAFYGNLLGNPLYLRLVLQEVAAEGVTALSRTALLERSFRRKVWRDRDPAARESLGPLDRFELVDRFTTLMENIAVAMTAQAENGHVLIETISAASALALARETFGSQDLTLLPVLLHSALVPVAIRSWQPERLAFVHRTFQEYFLARHLAKSAFDGRWPTSVMVFVEELLAQGFGSHAEDA